MSADINVGAITEALNNKVDLVMGVPQDAVDYVVAMQRPTADNKYTWYRKYKSGWVEQGGYVSMKSGNNSVALPVEMSEDYHFYSAKATAVVSTSDARIVQVLDTSSSSTLNVITNSAFAVMWQVSGMAA